MDIITIVLPWPPTINHYYLRRGNRTFIGPKGIAYRKEVIAICYHYRFLFDDSKRLRLILECFPPDKRKRDLDNLGKCCLDSLQHAKLFADDNQIDDLRFIRMPERIGKVLVHVGEI